MKPWHERFPSIYEYEQNFWLNKGFEQASLRAGEDIAFTGTITARVKLHGELQAHAFKLRVIYPPGYPYIPPRVEFLDPKIKRARHQGLDGAPCLFPPTAWTLNFPASELYVAIERWLGCHLAGSFPRELALYELPEYLPYRFGLGAIGSPMALTLTREGVGHFTLCDPDTLRPGNVIRHSLDLLSVGQFKAEAVESALARINPSIDTATETENLTHPDMIITRLRDADVVLLAIGDDLREELLGEIIATSEQSPPLILVRTLHAGDAFVWPWSGLASMPA